MDCLAEPGEAVHADYGFCAHQKQQEKDVLN